MPRVRLDGGVFGTTNNPTASVAAGVWSMKELEKYQRANLWPPPGSGIVPDTYFNRTTLLLHGDGSNNANNTVVVDSSINALTVTNTGRIYQGTFSPFSQTGWSTLFISTGGRLDISGLTAAGTGSVTYEAWIYPTNNTCVFLNSRTGNTTDGIDIQIGSSNQIRITYTNTVLFNGVTNSISFNTWYHVAVVRNGTTNWTVYLNGTSIGTFTASDNLTSTIFKIGQDSLNGQNYYGYITNVRVTNAAVYTSNFTPSLTPLTAITGTQLLTCQDNRFKDNSTNALTITPTAAAAGTVSVQPFSPFSPSTAYSNTVVGGSAYFSTKTDGLDLSGTADLTTFTGNFTIESWVYPTDTSLTNFWTLYDGRASGGTSAAFIFGLGNYSSGYQLQYFNSGTTVNSTGRVQVYTWSHVALERVGTTVTFYINGQASGTFTLSGTLTASGSGGTIRIGSKDSGLSGYGILGYISNYRITNGTAAYNGNFTPSTAPFTSSSVSNTKLLLNATNAGIIDHTAKNVITTAAGANISTTQSKYGGSSISLSGTSTGYLQLLSSNFNTIPASTDFTLECWVYTTASNRAPNVWHNVSSQKIIAFFLSSSDFNNISTIMGPFSYPASNASVVRGTTNIVANTWTHVAFVRSGSTITVYVDGTACGTGTSSYASLPLQLIGAISTGATTPDFYFFPGYIDDLRLTIGVARYTSNFTPSTTAFVDQ